MQNEKGFVILVGNSWSGEIDRWEDHVLRIPRKNANWVRNDQDHIITLPQMYFLQELVNYVLQLDNWKELKIECPSGVKTLNLTLVANINTCFTIIFLQIDFVMHQKKVYVKIISRYNNKILKL